MKIAILMLLMLAISGPVAADQEANLFNVVSLQAEAQGDVSNDEMIVHLRAEYEAVDSSAVATNINSKMQWALTQAEQFPEIDVQTHSYSTYPVYKQNTITGWRASQTMQLVSQDTKKMTDLVALLQTKLFVKSMRFVPMHATRLQAEHALIEQAMVAFKAKVEVVKRNMDNKNVRIVSLDIVTGKRYPQPRQNRMEMMSASSVDSMVSPAVSPGSSEVTVTVTGKVQFF